MKKRVLTFVVEVRQDDLQSTVFPPKNVLCWDFDIVERDVRCEAKIDELNDILLAK